MITFNDRTIIIIIYLDNDVRLNIINAALSIINVATRTATDTDLHQRIKIWNGSKCCNKLQNSIGLLLFIVIQNTSKKSSTYFRFRSYGLKLQFDRC